MTLDELLAMAGQGGVTIPVRPSTWISHGIYNLAALELTVVTLKGGEYTFYGVDPLVVFNFATTDSPGSFYHEVLSAY